MKINEYVEIDKTFNQGMFLTKVNNIFVKLLTAIMMDDLDSVRHFISDDVYNWAESIAKEVRDKGLRQMYDELNVKESKIDSIIEDSNQYLIKVYLQSRYLNYIINLSDGNLVSGNDHSRIQVNYNLIFTKKKTAQKQGIARKCPGCGAPISVNTSGKCEYCGSTYNQEDYDWVLTKLEVL